MKINKYSGNEKGEEGDKLVQFRIGTIINSWGENLSLEKKKKKKKKKKSQQ